MYLFNEQNKQLSIQDAKAELRGLKDQKAPTSDEVKNALGDYYNKALLLQAKNLQFTAAITPLQGSEESFLPGLGGKLLAELKKIVCAVLNGSSTEDEILNAVLTALGIIIPGGVFIKALANIVVKYLLNTGIGAFCNA